MIFYITIIHEAGTAQRQRHLLHDLRRVDRGRVRVSAASGPCPGLGLGLERAARAGARRHHRGEAAEVEAEVDDLDVVDEEVLGRDVAAHSIILQSSPRRTRYYSGVPHSV